ncbi:MAG TPA: DUF3037 domain-containing protein [Polyangiaceae bacterium]|nr:DUF3037 domain-containing protein [Polyangiaceae bacterium]
MAATKGFFSIIQYCPDLERGESANVGVVLVVPEAGFLGVQFSHDNEGPKQRFGKDAFDDARLTVAKNALEGRLREEGRSWTSADELLKFGKKEGNHLLLSTPRVILAVDPKAELEELYQRLVHVDARHRRRRAKPDLKTLFEPKVLDRPLRRNLHVSIPEMGTLEIPYAYKNGRLNLIKPEGFPLDEKSATSRANDLAVKGHLIYKHPDENGEERQLIIVGGFDPLTPETLKRRIGYVLREHEARLVREEEIDAFAEEVRREAHN